MPNGTKVSTLTMSPGAIRSTGFIRASNEPVCVLLGMTLSSWSAAAAETLEARSALNTTISAILRMVSLSFSILTLHHIRRASEFNAVRRSMNL
jgi:hypothetical protein